MKKLKWTLFIIAILFYSTGCSVLFQNNLDLESLKISNREHEYKNEIFGVWSLDKVVLRSKMYSDDISENGDIIPVDVEDYLGYEIEYSEQSLRLAEKTYFEPQYNLTYITPTEYEIGGNFRLTDGYPSFEELIEIEKIVIDGMDNYGYFGDVPLKMFEVTFDENYSIPVGEQCVMLNKDTMLVGIWGKIILAHRVNLEKELKNPENYEFGTIETESPLLTGENLTASGTEYCKYIAASETKYLSNVSFELTGINEQGTSVYYPVKLIVRADGDFIQEIVFQKEEFASCTLDDFGFEFGDFRFDGYGGFTILETSMGKNPSSLFWLWDEDTGVFARYPDLEMMGYISFDYEDELIHVSNTGSATYHELATYKYIDEKLTMIKKVVDADNDGYRKVYELLEGRLELIEVTESQLK